MVLKYIYDNLSSDEKDKFKDSTVLITGCGGFLGYYFMHFFDEWAEDLGVKKVIGLDNFILRLIIRINMKLLILVHF